MIFNLLRTNLMLKLSRNRSRLRDFIPRLLAREALTRENLKNIKPQAPRSGPSESLIIVITLVLICVWIRGGRCLPYGVSLYRKNETFFY